MPFKSEAQRKYMYSAASKGDISPRVVEEFAKATPHGKTLPEHVKAEYPKLHKFIKKKGV